MTTNQTHQDIMDNIPELLTPAEVAAYFRVCPKTVTRWAKAGKITAIRTIGGHRRFRANDVKAFIAANTDEVTETDI